jgi:hypothetical protein
MTAERKRAAMRERTEGVLFSQAVKGTAGPAKEAQPTATEEAAPPTGEEPPAAESEGPAPAESRSKRRRRNKRARKQAAAKETKEGPQQAPLAEAAVQPTLPPSGESPPSLSSLSPTESCSSISHAAMTSTAIPERRSTAVQGEPKDLWSTIRIICSALEQMISSEEGRLLLSLLRSLVDTRLAAKDGSTA